VTWNNPGAFGPVPAELLHAGQKRCSSLGTPDIKFKAIVCLAPAINLDGNPLPRGGCFCVRE
jgi:hypothetical protein